MDIDNSYTRRDETNEEKLTSVRPKSFEDFIGQSEIKNNLTIFAKSAKKRDVAMDHVLFYGPPGLGKTTLAQIIAYELGVNFKSTSGPILTKSGDLAALLTNLEPRDVLFIDEIHRLNPVVEEVLYPALEDFSLDLIGKFKRSSISLNRPGTRILKLPVSFVNVPAGIRILAFLIDSNTSFAVNP